MTPQKHCTKCGETKPAAEFYIVASRPDGLSGYCRPCQKADAASRQVRTGPRKRKAPEGEKWCPKCEKAKPIDTFGNNRTAFDGKQPYCKPCSVAAVTASRHKDPTSHRASSKNWREQNADRHADNNARWKYGIEHGTYTNMLVEQGGRCAICDTEDPGNGLNRFHIDHCHDTGAIRGLLCSNCNTGLGQLKHNKEILKRAIVYLEQPPSSIT